MYNASCSGRLLFQILYLVAGQEFVEQIYCQSCTDGSKQILKGDVTLVR
jgi:predicted metal-binding protein